MENINLSKNWKVIQDVHDAGETLEIYKRTDAFTDTSSQISEWEPLEELKHLQLVFSDEPYFGRELRYFNQAPWWYQKEFEVSFVRAKKAFLRFSNVDYYCKVWLNGTYLGSHEGYSAPFFFEVHNLLNYDAANYVTVKVSSPWDDEVESPETKNWTTLVRRNMVKGTYEHSDTLIQRDVNPIGIYGTVELELENSEFIVSDPNIQYQLNLEEKSAEIKAEVKLDNLKRNETYCMRIFLKDKDSGEICVSSEAEFQANEEYMNLMKILSGGNIHLWNTWDHGGPWMYQLEIVLEKDGSNLDKKNVPFAFRSIELERNKERTCFYINKKPFFIRGTSYFPDNYISAMSYERYLRDLINIKSAGFNLVRVHVHVEQQIFYQLCDELGIAVIQDSEYNWTHPSTDEWAEKFIGIYKENIKTLMNHPSIISWIGMNEPGCADPDGKTRLRFMEENPGPKMYKEISAMDPGRPVIKGSFCENDPYSGDSHNYLGSLSGGQYRDIYGTTEKLNTEYGFDAPACEQSLRKNQKLFHRLDHIKDQIPNIQEYQYHLLKYYTEHYRMQKYQPCSGYVQFMFIDLAPESFYGVYDWWGIPKKGLQALYESNMPLGVFVKYKDKLDGIYVVNDLDDSYNNCTLQWTIIDHATGKMVCSDTKQIDIAADSITEAKSLGIKNTDNKNWNVALKLLDKKGVCIAKNTYQNIFYLPNRVDGHPQRMSHELGMRLYRA